MARTQTRQVVIRMTEEEFGAMKKRVERSGMPQAQFLREAILKKEIVNTDGAKALSHEIKKIGINLNQIARSYNEGRIGAGQIAGELENAWQSLRRSIQSRA